MLDLPLGEGDLLHHLQVGEQARFGATLVLQADAKTEETVEVRAKMNEAAWTASSYGRIVVDFLSGPNG